jgi:hypothetical protein
VSLVVGRVLVSDGVPGLAPVAVHDPDVLLQQRPPAARGGGDPAQPRVVPLSSASLTVPVAIFRCSAADNMGSSMRNAGGDRVPSLMARLSRPRRCPNSITVGRRRVVSHEGPAVLVPPQHGHQSVGKSPRAPPPAPAPEKICSSLVVTGRRSSCGSLGGSKRSSSELQVCNS